MSTDEGKPGIEKIESVRERSASVIDIESCAPYPGPEKIKKAA
jgi:hypothetical protein